MPESKFLLTHFSFGLTWHAHWVPTGYIMNAIPSSVVSSLRSRSPRRAEQLVLKFNAQRTGRLRLRIAVLALFAAIFVPLAATAATYYWDCNGASAGFGPASGGWSTSPNWSISSDGTASPGYVTITTGDDVNFGTASAGLGFGTLTGPSSAQGFRNMTFGAASGFSITLSGGYLNLASPASTITVNNSQGTLSGTVLGGGSAGLIKDGPGVLALANGSYCTYSGSTTVSNGLLRLNDGSINSSTNIYVYGGTLEIVYDNALADAAVVTVAGGSLDWGAIYAPNQTDTIKCLYIGPGSVSGAGTMVLNNVGSTGIRNTTGDNTVSCKINLGSFGLDFGCDTGTLTLNGVVSGNNGLDIYPSTSTVVFGTSNTYSGTTDVYGKLRLGVADAIKPGNNVNVQSTGILDLNGYAQTLSYLQGYGSITNSGGSLTVGSGNVYGVISGGGGLNITGNLWLYNNNTYTGTTTLNGTQLYLRGSINSSTNVTINAGHLFTEGERIADNAVVNMAGGSFELYYGSETIKSLYISAGSVPDSYYGSHLCLTNAGATGIRNTSGNNTIGCKIELGSQSTPTDNLDFGCDAGTLILNGVISSSAGHGLDIYPAGSTVVFGANNTYGGLTHPFGRLLLGTDNAIKPGNNLMIESTGIFDLNGFAQTLDSLTGTGVVTNNGGALTVGSGNSSFTFGGVISGTGSVTKSGAGTLTLSSTNTFSGVMSINGGTVKLAYGPSIPGIKGDIVVNSGGALWLSQYNQLGYYGIAPANTVTLNSGGALNWTNTVEGFHNLTLNNTSLTLRGGYDGYWGALNIYNTLTATGNSAITAASGSNNGLSPGPLGTLTLNVATPGAGDSLNIAVGIQNHSGNAYTLSKTGAGTLTLSAVNTYSGLTTVSDGVLVLGHSSDTLDGPITVNGGILLTENPDTVGTVTLISGRIVGDSPLTGSSYDLRGGDSMAVLAGSGALTKSTSGTVILAAHNTYSGVTTVSAGTLVLNGGINSSSTVNVTGGTLDNGVGNTLADTTTVTLSGGALAISGNDTIKTIAISGGTVSGGGTLKLSNGGAWGIHNTSGSNVISCNIDVGSGSASDNMDFGCDSGSGALVFNGVVSSSVGFGMDIVPAGTVVFGNNNTYPGKTRVFTTLRLGTDNGIKPGNNVEMQSGGILDLNSFDQTLDQLTGGGTITPKGGTLTVGSGNSSFNYSGLFSGTNGMLAKTGSGTLTIGANSDGFTGNVAVSGGMLYAVGRPCAPNNTCRIVARNGGIMSFRASNLFGTPHIGTTIPTVVADAGGIISNDTGYNPLNDVELNGGTLTATASYNASWLSWAINGSITSKGNSTFSGGTAPSPGAMLKCVGSGPWETSVNVVDGVLNISAPLFNGRNAASPYAEHATSLIKTGAGTLVFSTNNTYTGTTTINGGTLKLNNPTATRGISGNITVESGGALAFSQYNELGRDLGVNAPTNTVTLNSGGEMNWTNTVETFNNLTLNNATLGLNGGFTADPAWGTLSIYNTLTANGTCAITAVSGTDNTLSPGASTGPRTLSVAVPGSSDSLNLNIGIRDYGTTNTYALVKSGAGTLTLSGANTYTNTTTINGGTLVVGGAGRLGNGAYAGLITNNGDFVYDSSAAQTLSGVISGTGTLTKSGAGAFTLSGANTYTNLTTVTGGTLVLGHTSDTLDGDITVSGGTLSVDNPDTVGAITLTSGSIIGDSALTGTGYAVEGGIISAVLAGSGALTKTTTTTAVLAAPNTYSGLTTINGGTLQLDNTGGTKRGIVGNVTINSGGVLSFSQHNQLGSLFNATAPTNTVTLNSGGALKWTNTVEAFNNLTLNNASFGLNGGYGDIPAWGALNIYDTLTATGNCAIAVASGSNNTLSPGAGTGPRTLNVNVPSSGDRLSIAAPIQDYSAADTYALAKAGSGTLTLSGVNTYTNTTTINGGTLVVGGAGQLGSGTYSAAITNNGAFVYGSSAAQTLAGIIRGSGALTKSGTGTLTLSAANIYAGVTTVSGGTLTLGNPTNTLAGDVTISGGTLDVANPDTVGTVTLTSGTISGPATLAGSGYYVQSGTISASLAGGYLGKSTTGTVAISGSININSSSPIEIYNGVLRLDANNVFADGARLYFLGGTLDLNGHSDTVSALYTFYNIVQLNNGSLACNDLNIGYATSSNSSFDLNGTASVTSGTIRVGGSGTGHLYLGGSSILTGEVKIANFNGGSGILFLNGGCLSTPGVARGASSSIAGFYFNGGMLKASANNSSFMQGLDYAYVRSGGACIDSQGYNITIGQPLWDGGGGGLLKSGSGNLTLSSDDHTFSGAITISNGTLTIGGAGRLGRGSYAGLITNNAAFVYNSSAAQTLSGSIKGTGTLTKSSAGTLTLTGVNTYSGATTVSGGKLALDGSGSINSSPIIEVGSGATFDVSAVSGGYTLASSQLLRGVGNVNGAITVASGAVLSPGLSIGTLTMNSNLTLNGGSKVGVEVNRSASPKADKVQGIRTLTMNGTLYVTNNGAALQSGDSFTLFAATNYSGEFTAISPANPNNEPSDPDLAWDSAYFKTNGLLRVHHVPYATNRTVLRAKGTSTKIRLGDLFPSTDPVDSDAVVLHSFTDGSQGAGITTNASHILYAPANDNGDSLTYTVKDQRGATRTRTITVLVTNAVASVTITNSGGGTIGLNFHGIPGWQYVIQRSCGDLGSWLDLSSPLIAPSNGANIGLIEYLDTPGESCNPAYYRVRQN